MHEGETDLVSPPGLTRNFVYSMPFFAGIRNTAHKPGGGGGAPTPLNEVTTL